MSDEAANSPPKDDDQLPDKGAALAGEALSKAFKSADLDDEALKKAIADLSPEEARMFAEALDMALRRRRIMLFGYIGALVCLVVGMLIALYVYGTREPGTFVGWVFLLPFAAVGILLTTAGRLAKRGKPIVPTDHPTTDDS